MNLSIFSTLFNQVAKKKIVLLPRKNMFYAGLTSRVRRFFKK
jgi:hypothetical protein